HVAQYPEQRRVAIDIDGVRVAVDFNGEGHGVLSFSNNGDLRPVRRGQSVFGNVNDGLSKSLRRLLRQVVSDAALNGEMLVSARELLGVSVGLEGGWAIGSALERIGGHRDDGALGKPLLQVVVFRLAFGETEPPAVIVDHDADVIRIIEGGGAAL